MATKCIVGAKLTRLMACDREREKLRMIVLGSSDGVVQTTELGRIGRASAREEERNPGS